MVSNIPLLDEVKVAAPCPKRWDDMIGGDRVRFCRDCSKNVYNLSEMTQDEAEQLLQTHEGRLCVQFYRRSDGKIMTQNCPVGLRAVRRAFLKSAAQISALGTAIFGTSFAIIFPALTVTGGERARKRTPDEMRQEVKYLQAEVAKAKHALADKKQPPSSDERESLKDTIESDEGRIGYFQQKLTEKNRSRLSPSQAVFPI